MREAVAAEVERLKAINDPLDRVRAIGDTFAAVDEALADLLVVRMQVIAKLRAEEWSYNRIAEATGLSKPRVAQLAREAARRKM